MEFKYLNKTGLQYKIDAIKTLDFQADEFIADELDDVEVDISELETEINEFESGLDWKQSVATYDDIATTYPEPEDGWTVTVLDTDYTYRYNGTDWVAISASAIPDATEQNKGLMTTTQAGKLQDLENYVLPKASVITLGGIRPDDDTIETDPDTGETIAHGSIKRVSDLSDVSIRGLMDGQILSYDAEQNKWKNTARAAIEVELDDVSGASAVADSANQTAILKWTDPSDKYLNTIPIVEWDGTKIVRKVGSAPTDITDGVVVVDSKIRNQYSFVGFVDTGLLYNTTYYYRFFPYSKKNRITDGTVLTATIREQKVNIPVVVGSYTYNGNQQTVNLSSNTGFTLSGDYTATNAGTYTAITTLDSGYMWNDNSYEPKNIQWTINKATSDIIAEYSSMVIDENHLTRTDVISNLLGREVTSVTSSDTSVVTVTYDSATNTITAAHVNQTEGSSVITVVTNASTNYNASTITIRVSASFASGTLDDNSWATINAKAIDGTASSLWNVGDRKRVTITGTVQNATLSGDYYLFILGFNHNAENSGGNDIHFMFGFSSATDGSDVCIFPDNESSDIGSYVVYVCNPNLTYGAGTTRGNRYGGECRSGWQMGQLKNKVIPEFEEILPSDLSSVLSCRKIYCEGTFGNITKNYCYEKITIPSEYEISGAWDYAKIKDVMCDSQYDYYKNGNARIKQSQTLSGNKSWTLRTLNSSASAGGVGNECYHIYVRSDGRFAGGTMTNPYQFGFVPIFIVGKMNYDEVPSWSAATDAQIVDALNAHNNGQINIYDCWNIGDERIIHLGGDINEDVTMVLMNRGGKQLAIQKSGSSIYVMGNDCTFVVGQKNCLSNKKVISSVYNRTTPWGSQTDTGVLRQWLNTTYYNALPEYMMELFKTFYITCDHNSSSWYGRIATSMDKITIPSPMEVCEDSLTYSNSETARSEILHNYNDMNYNHKFEYYRKYSAKKTLGNSSSTYVKYWTRYMYLWMNGDSPNRTENWQCISENGQIESALYNTELGIAPYGVI